MASSSLYSSASILLHSPISLFQLSLPRSFPSSSQIYYSSSCPSSVTTLYNCANSSHILVARVSWSRPFTGRFAANTSSDTTLANEYSESSAAATTTAGGGTHSSGEEGQFEEVVPSQEPAAAAPRVRKPAETTDWIASSLSRRFGLGAGLAWFGFLAFGVISEQLKTRFEVLTEQQGTRDVENATVTVLPNKVSYVDLRVGGGSSPRKGDLVVVDLVGKVQITGQVFVDTISGSRRPLAFVFGARPYSRGMCEGVESALQSMKVGGKRKVGVPSDMGFGQSGADFGEGQTVPPGASLEYIVELKTVSVSPS